MKTLKLLGAALAAVTMTFTAQAVTTNRVTVTSTAGTSSVAGSLAYYVKNAPTNGNVLEITVPHDMVCLLDEPLEITSEQSIVIRSEINPTLKPPFSLLPGGGTIAFTHTLYATKKYAFDVQGFLRLEQMSIGEDDSVAEHGDLRDVSAFWVSGKLEFWRSQMGLGKAARYGRGAGVFLAYSRALFENSLLYVGSDYRTTQHASDVEGTLLYSLGGSMTMANCICASASSKCAFYFTDSNAQSLFVNCNLGGGRNDVNGCTIRYSSVAEGKHWIVGSRLGYNEQYEKPGHWEERVNPTTGLTYSEYVYEDEWIVDKTSTRYQVECEGSGRPVIRASLVESRKPTDHYANVEPANGNCEIVNCTVADWGPDATGIGRYDLFAGYWKPYLYGLYRGNGREVVASWVQNLPPYPTSVIFGQGAWIWHDKDWNNVVGEDTERFTIRGDAEAAVIPLDADLFGKPISVENRPTPSALQWNEPTLVVDSSNLGFPLGESMRFAHPDMGFASLREELLESIRITPSDGFILGETTLQSALAYARDDWRGERKLLGSDGFYHLSFADGIRGSTIAIDALIPVDIGMKVVIEGGGTTLDAQGATGIFQVEGAELVLKDLTLKGGRKDGPLPDSSLANSRLSGALLSLQNYLGELNTLAGGEGEFGELVSGELISGELISSDVTVQGAAIRIAQNPETKSPGRVTLENCRIEDCLATEAGGAIYLENNGCAVTVRNSSFVRCGLVNPASGKGGAIAAAGESGLNGKLTLQDVVFAECGGGETFNDVINLGAAFKADMTGVVMSGGAHGGIYVASGAALTLNNSVIAGNGGYDFAGTLGSVQGSNVYYGSRMAEFWEADFTQVNDPSTVIGSTVREKTVRGVQQAYYDLQVNLPPAPPVTCTVTFASNGGTAVAAQTVAPGGLAKRPSDPTALGYVFDGWYVDKDFKKAYDFATAVNFDLTLYAKWNQLTAKVVVEDGGATLRFVFDASNYGDKGTDWFSVADAETIDPVSGSMPWVGCASSVTKVIFDSSFADFKPRHCGGWFWYFSSLASVVGLENLDGSKATSLARMFVGCSSLTSLDLAGFDTSCVTDMRVMFYGCTSLKRITVGDKFVTTSVTASDGMFYDCTALVGGAGTAYDSAMTDATYACIDGEGGQPGYFTRGYAAKGVAGKYGKWTLPDLGIEPPAAGTVYAVKAYGLPSGLKLKYNAAKKDKKGRVIVKAKTDWWVEGVPTAALNALERPMYLAVTVGKKTTWYPIAFAVRAQKVTDLGTFSVGTAFNETGWLPGLAGGGWSVSGLPKGLKYTANIVYKDPKKKSKGIKYAADTTYGKLSAAGLYTITAKKKNGGFYETLKFRVLVNPAGEFTTRNFTAYETFATMKDTSWKAVSGLPAGLKFDAKKYTVSGKITKAGTFAVAFTDKKGKKKTEMWIVTANPAGPSLGFNTTGEKTMSVLQGQKGKLNEITFPADGTVSVSGLPKGMRLVKRTDPETGVVSYALGGVPSVTGTYFVTVKAAKNGQTVTQRVAVTVKTNPLAGTYFGYSQDKSFRYRTASLSIAASGKATLKYTEGSKTYTLTASAGELQSKYSSYTFVQKANSVKKIPARTARVAVGRLGDGICGGEWGVCTGTTWDTDMLLSSGEIFKALSASVVNALRTDLLTGFAPKSTYVLTSKVDPAQVIYATSAYSSSTGKFTVKGKLPLGKAFSATVPAVFFENGDLRLAPISAADADGTRYLLELMPQVDKSQYVYMDGFEVFEIDSRRYDFGTGYTVLPTIFASAIAMTSIDFCPVEVVYSSGEKEVFCIRASGSKYFQVSFDDGATWGAKTEYAYDKARGLITLSFTKGKTKYTLDLLYAAPSYLHGQMKRQSNPVYNKKTKKTTYTTEYGKAIGGVS